MTLVTLDYATLIFLVLVFVAAEAYRMRRGESGVIVSVRESSLGPVPLPVVRIDVRLESGTEVMASLDCCTACLGRLAVGDEIRIVRSGEGYKVALPWVRSGQTNRCVRRCGVTKEVDAWGRAAKIAQKHQRTGSENA